MIITLMYYYDILDVSFEQPIKKIFIKYKPILVS